MTSILKEHALSNIWCEPSQDRHYVIKPERITQPGGVFRYTTLMGERLDLPLLNNSGMRNFFHVYQIGKLNDNMFNLDLSDNVWYNVKDLCEYQQIQIDTYLSNGAVLSRSDVYLLNVANNNFIVAIRFNRTFDIGKSKQTSKITGAIEDTPVTLDTHFPTLRFYKSAWFNSTDYRKTTPDLNYPIRSVISVIANQSSYNNFNSSISSLNKHYGTFGMGTYYLDGYVQSMPKNYSVSLVGKTFTYIWDSSIKSRNFIPVTEAPTFSSILDKYTRKYLVMLNEKSDVIDFMDDVEFHLVALERDGSYRGVYIDRLNENSIRMVTHNSYAIYTEIINNLLIDNEWLSDLSKLHFMVTVRHGGLKRGLISQATKLEELYRLERSEILQAMTGVNSVIPEWRAEYLENSNYNKVMSLPAEKINEDMVENAYGYNAAAMVGADPLHDVIKSGDSFIVRTIRSLNIPTPWDNLIKRHGFLYDINGKYIDNYESVSSSYEDIIQNDVMGSELKYAEVYNGEILTEDNVIYNSDVSSYGLTHYGYRCYVCPIANNNITEVWQDVTDSDYYTFINDGINAPSVKWNFNKLSELKLYPAVKIANGTLLYKHEFVNNEYPGYISFPIQVLSNFNGVSEKRNLSIPFGQVDVILNGDSLVENIDYYMNWPVITITRKPNDAVKIDVIVKMRGFCNPVTMKPFGIRDNGFVQRGALSVDSEYDLRADRNIRVIVNGRIYRKDEVTFAEDKEIINKPVVEGMAWGISDQFISIEHFTNKTTLDFMMKSYELDDRVKSYLTPRIKTYVPEDPYIYSEPWGLTSPFLSAILHGFTKYSFLNNIDLLNVTISAEKMDNWLRPYKDLLNYDPCLDDNLDTGYIRIYPHIYPHAIEVTAGQYRFLEYVIRHFLRNRVDLTPSIKIKD